MSHLFKTNAKMFLKATVRPDFRPQEPDPEDMKEIPDANTWVFDEFTKLRDVITNIIQPLDEYIVTYNKYKSEYEIDPDAIFAKWVDPEDWPDVDTLKNDVMFHQAEEKRL
jgi:hypothetical protein